MNQINQTGTTPEEKWYCDEDNCRYSYHDDTRCQGKANASKNIKECVHLCPYLEYDDSDYEEEDMSD